MSFSPPPETVGERVRRQRKRLKLDVRELAERAGVNAATVARVEGGATPREDTLARLAKALDAPVAWLRDGTK
jgi:transcriptional regulator with XRE-family HTH domain